MKPLDAPPPPPPDRRRDPKVMLLAGLPAVLIGAALVWWLDQSQPNPQQALDDLEAQARAEQTAAALVDAGVDGDAQGEQDGAL